MYEFSLAKSFQPGPTPRSDIVLRHHPHNLSITYNLSTQGEHGHDSQSATSIGFQTNASTCQSGNEGDGCRRQSVHSTRSVPRCRLFWVLPFFFSWSPQTSTSIFCFENPRVILYLSTRSDLQLRTLITD